jgi:uncharacterized SAM-binding protein YcdF (DUF218 family)
MLGRSEIARVGQPQRGGIIFRLLFLIALICLCFVLYLIRHPLLRIAGGFWVVDESPQASDAIVMLGDDNFDADRAARAAQLFKAGWAPRIIASGRYLRPYETITDLEQRDLTDRGVPQNAIVRFAHHAENTREEMFAIGQLLQAHGWKRILLVTSNYHTRRARYLAERAFPAGTVLRVIAAPDSDYDPNDWWRSRTGWKRFGLEFAGMFMAIWESRHDDVRTTEAGIQDDPPLPFCTAMEQCSVYTTFPLYYSFLTV